MYHFRNNYLYLTMIKFYAKPALPVCPIICSQHMQCDGWSAFSFCTVFWYDLSWTSCSLLILQTPTLIWLLLGFQDVLPVCVLCHEALSHSHTHPAMWIRSFMYKLLLSGHDITSIPRKCYNLSFLSSRFWPLRVEICLIYLCTT